MVYAILGLIIAYLIGSFPSGLVIGKIKGIDIRNEGSGNLGATNAIRVLGKKLGLLVFALDTLKGALITIVALLLYENYPIDFDNITPFDFFIFKPIYYAIPAIIGHMYPVFANFKGGKAVATSLGMALVLTPIPALLCLVVFIIVLKTTGYVSLSSTFAILTVCISSFILHQDMLEVNILYCIIALAMIIKHRKNYIRIFKGTENSFKKKKEVSEETSTNSIDSIETK